MVSENVFQKIVELLALKDLYSFVFLNFESIEIVWKGGLEIDIKIVILNFDIHDISSWFEGNVSG